MLTPQFDFEMEGIDEFFEDFTGLVDELSVGVSTEGDAAGYALVWEWGNVRQTKPGPKTVLGTNPDGRMVWLSIQAPFGYIRRNEPAIMEMLDFEMQQVNFHQTNNKALQREIERHLDNVAKGAADMIREDAPEDSGDLKSSIKPVYAGDSLLDEVGNRYETLVIRKD